MFQNEKIPLSQTLRREKNKDFWLCHPDWTQNFSVPHPDKKKILLL